MKVRETAENTKRMERCPSFEHCDAPKCPLDELYDVRVFIAGDKTCVAERPTRLALGVGLPNEGLFPREYAAIIRFYGTWEAYLSHQKEYVKQGEIS